MTDQNKEPQERNEGTRSNALTRVMDIIGAYNSIAPEADEILQGGVTDAVIDATERPEHEEFEEYYQKLPDQELETHPERIEHLEEAARRLSHKTGQDFTAAPKIQDGGYTARLMQNQRRLDAAMRAVKNALDTFVKSEEWDRLKAEFPGLEDMDALFIAYMVEDLIEYAPEIREILQGYREQGRDIDFRGLIYGEPPQDAGPEGFIEYVLNRAQEIRKNRRGRLPKVKYEPAASQQIQLNIDKAMRMLFNPRTGEKVTRLGIPLYVRDKAKGYKPKRGEIPGQLSFFPVSYEKEGKEEITLYYALDYDGDMLKKLGLPEETTAEDFFILSFIRNAAVTGNTELSANKLYKDFAGREPNAEDRTRFVNRLMKMAGTMVDIDDREVMEAWGQDTYNQYYGQLAPLEFINERFVVNGGIANCRIKITNTPRVLQTGQKIGQYITIPKSLLYVKKYPQGKDKNGNRKKPRAVKRTPRFYELLMILLKEIAMIKNGKRINKILYSTLYKELDITEKDYHARKDIIDMLYVMLEHFRREQWITGYKEETTKSTGEVGVKIEWRNTGKGPAPIEKKGRRKAPARTPDNKS